MRLSEIYISADTKSLLRAIAEIKRATQGGMTADQIGDELLQEIIHHKYPNAQKFLDQMQTLRKELANALREK